MRAGRPHIIAGLISLFVDICFKTRHKHRHTWPHLQIHPQYPLSLVHRRVAEQLLFAINSFVFQSSTVQSRWLVSLKDSYRVPYSAYNSPAVIYLCTVDKMLSFTLLLFVHSVREAPHWFDKLVNLDGCISFGVFFSIWFHRRMCQWLFAPVNTMHRHSTFDTWMWGNRNLRY